MPLALNRVGFLGVIPCRMFNLGLPMIPSAKRSSSPRARGTNSAPTTQLDRQIRSPWAETPSGQSVNLAADHAAAEDAWGGPWARPVLCPVGANSYGQRPIVT